VPRPSMEDQVRQAVRGYLATAVAKTPAVAPLNVLAVAKQTGFDRKTLKKYSLEIEIAAAAEEQKKRAKPCPTPQRSQADALHDRNEEIAILRQRCEALIARICIAEGNAQRLGIDPVELWKPLAMPDRSVSHAGGGPRRRGSWRTPMM